MRTHKFLRIFAACTLITDRTPPSIIPIRDAYGFIAGGFFFTGRNACAHSLECRESGWCSRADSIRLYRVNGPAVPLIEQFCILEPLSAAECYRLDAEHNMYTLRQFRRSIRDRPLRNRPLRFSPRFVQPFRFISPFALYRSRSSISS